MTNGAYQQISWAIYPDLMDITRSESGNAIEGAFSAVWLFGQKVANAIAEAYDKIDWKKLKEGKNGK